MKILNRKKKKKKQRWSKTGGVAHFNSGVREDISEKVTFELRQKGGKAVSQVQLFRAEHSRQKEKQGIRPGGRTGKRNSRERESLTTLRFQCPF